MPLPLSLSGSSRSILVSSGITLLHLGLFGILAAQPTTPVVLPEVTPVQLIALAPDPAPAAPAPEPAGAPAPPKPEQPTEVPARKSPPKPAIKPERKPVPTQAAKTPTPKEPAPQRSPTEGPPAQAEQSDSSSDTPGTASSGKGHAKSGVPTGPAIELPSTRASYLNNPKPPYPASSKRMGETGTVLLRVVVGADGSAERVALQKSSGFDALDNSALNTVRRWRFVPGKRNGVPAAMEYTVPIAFRLE